MIKTVESIDPDHYERELTELQNKRLNGGERYDR
jgi:hypothetical protein